MKLIVVALIFLTSAVGCQSTKWDGADSVKAVNSPKSSFNMTKDGLANLEKQLAGEEVPLTVLVSTVSTEILDEAIQHEYESIDMDEVSKLFTEQVRVVCESSDACHFKILN